MFGEAYGDGEVMVPDDNPVGRGEECVEEFEEEAELESGTWNAGTERVGRSSSGVPWGRRWGVGV